MELLRDRTKRENKDRENPIVPTHTHINQTSSVTKPEPVQVHCIKEQLTRVAIYARSQDSDQEQKEV